MRGDGVGVGDVGEVHGGAQNHQGTTRQVSSFGWMGGCAVDMLGVVGGKCSTCQCLSFSLLT